MLRNYKNLVIIVLLISNIILALKVYIKSEPTITVNNTEFEQIEKRLKAEKDSLLKLIAKDFTKVDNYKHTIDSLKSIKKEVKYVYVQKYKEVDSSYAVGLVSKFENLFAKGGIK